MTDKVEKVKEDKYFINSFNEYYLKITFEINVTFSRLRNT